MKKLSLKLKITVEESKRLFWGKVSEILGKKLRAPVTGEEQERVMRQSKLIKLGLSKKDISELMSKDDYRERNSRRKKQT